MSTKEQHYVPRVYLKRWEIDIRHNTDIIRGLYCFDKKDRYQGKRNNKKSILWKPRLYNVNYAVSCSIEDMPKVRRDYDK